MPRALPLKESIIAARKEASNSRQAAEKAVSAGSGDGGYSISGQVSSAVPVILYIARTYTKYDTLRWTPGPSVKWNTYRIWEMRKPPDIPRHASQRTSVLIRTRTTVVERGFLNDYTTPTPQSRTQALQQKPSAATTKAIFSVQNIGLFTTSKEANRKVVPPSEYMIVGGLVLVTLKLEYVREEYADEQIVILSQVLKREVNIDCEGVLNRRLMELHDTHGNAAIGARHTSCELRCAFTQLNIERCAWDVSTRIINCYR